MHAKKPQNTKNKTNQTNKQKETMFLGQSSKVRYSSIETCYPRFLPGSSSAIQSQTKASLER